MQFQVRDAREADAGFIVDANRRMAAETEGLSLDAAVVTRGVRAVLRDPAKGRYFVATQGGDLPVGQLMVTFEWSDWRDGNLWWVQSVYVDPAFRRQGVFSGLYRHVREMARAAGAAGLRLYVEEHNDNARQTYLRLGMAMTHYRVMEEILR